MKSRLLFGIGLLLFVGLSCKKDKNNKLEAIPVSKIYGNNCSLDLCPEISIDYLKFEGDLILSEKINEKITNYIVNVLNYNEHKLDSSDIELATTYFIEDYANDKKEFPDIITPYSAEIIVSKAFENSRLLCLEMQHYLFTGGAHGYGAVLYLNIDPQTGENLGMDDLLKTPETFKTFAEEKFRERFKIEKNQGINSTGFWFENDSFELPETLGFTDKEVILIYNQYNIASYADGPIELILPLKEAMPFLKLN